MSKSRRFLYYSLFSAILALTVLGTTGHEKVRSAPLAPAAQQGAVCIASQMTGRDIGAKINACDARLGSAKGTIKLSGGGTIATPVVVSPNHTLQIISGTYRATNNGAVIRLKDDSSLVCDSWDAVLLESTGNNDAGGVKPFVIVAAYNGSMLDSPNGNMTRNLTVKGCHFKGARSDFDSVSQTVALGNCHNCSATNNWLDATRTIGIQVGGGSALGKYADTVVISNNQLTNVASQNLAVVNSMNVQVIDNTIKSPGLAGGPGVVPIDIEPNVGDRIVNVRVANNLIDATTTPIDSSGAKGLHGIAINNLNGAKPFTGVEVTSNTIYGANLNDPHNHISGGLILARGAQNTVIANNIMRRGTHCVLVDSGSSRVRISGNQMSTCGSGSTVPLKIEDSYDNEILNNKLWGDPANLYDFSAISKNIVEFGASDNNVFRGNDGVVSIIGRRSRKL